MRAQLRAADAARFAAGAYKDVAEIGADGFYEGREAIAALPDKVAVYQGGFAGLPIDLPQEILDFLGENPPPSGTYRIGDTEIIIDGGNITIYQYIHVSMPVAAHFAPNAYWQAWVGVNSAQAAYEGLQRVLGLLYRLRDNPTELRAAVEEAAALCRQAEAQERMAQAQVDGLRAGATDEELAALEALLAVAEAELEVAQVELAKQTLVAPADGMVLKRPLEVGELAGPGGPLLVLADLARVYLTLYMPNRDLARVRPGESIAIWANGYAEPFTGTIIAIGQEAEFPPSNVPQPEDRAALVFSVRVQIENGDHRLKPGILATATFK